MIRARKEKPGLRGTITCNHRRAAGTRGHVHGWCRTRQPALALTAVIRPMASARSRFRTAGSSTWAPTAGPPKPASRLVRLRPHEPTAHELPRSLGRRLNGYPDYSCPPLGACNRPGGRGPLESWSPSSCAAHPGSLTSEQCVFAMHLFVFSRTPTFPFDNQGKRSHNRIWLWRYSLRRRIPMERPSALLRRREM